MYLLRSLSLSSSTGLLDRIDTILTTRVLCLRKKGALKPFDTDGVAVNTLVLALEVYGRQLPSVVITLVLVGKCVRLPDVS